MAKTLPVHTNELEPTMEVVDLFGSAPVVKLKEEPEVKSNNLPFEDVEALTACDYVTDTIAGVRSLLESSVKAQATQHFVSKGITKKSRPDNFKAEEGKGITGCEFRKRGSNRPLSADEIKTLRAYSIEPKKEETPAIEDRYFFNPKLIENPEYRAKISAALAGIDFGGEQVITKQEGTPASIKYVVTDETIDQVFKATTNEEDTATLLKIVTTMSLKPNFNGNLQEALEVIAKAGLDLRKKAKK